MKFDQLQMGQRFEWSGATYVKTGPVVAHEEATGKSRMIPRYAVLKLVGEMLAQPRKEAPVMVSREAVLAAFDIFCTECAELLARCPGGATGEQLQAARERFLTAL
jgi:hypothetical protein